jgi:hypothetical protein
LKCKTNTVFLILMDHVKHHHLHRVLLKGTGQDSIACMYSIIMHTQNLRNM